MKIGDLVKHAGMNDVVWFGIIAKQGALSLTTPYKYYVEWNVGVGGWFYAGDLEVIA